LVGVTVVVVVGVCVFVGVVVGVMDGVTLGVCVGVSVGVIVGVGLGHSGQLMLEHPPSNGPSKSSSSNSVYGPVSLVTI
jgi:hypothetical protein